MKAKNIFVLLGLSLSLSVGVVAGFAAAQPKEANAETTSVEIAGSFTDWATNKVAMTLDGDWYVYERDFAVDDEFKVVVNNTDWVSANWNGVELITGIVDGGGESHNFKIDTAGEYRIKAAKTIGDYGEKGYGVKLEKIVPAADRIISVIIDLGDLVNIEGFNDPEVCFFDASYETFEASCDLHRLTSLNESLYTVNFPYHISQPINCIKYSFKEGETVKWSENVSINTSKDYVYHFQYLGHWDQGLSGDKWDIDIDSTWRGKARVQGGGDDSTHNNGVNFDIDYTTATGKVTYEIIDASDNVQIFLGKWGYGAVRASSIAKYATNFTLNGFTMNETGTYDFLWHNDYSDGGIIEIKKHGSVNSYIYYVTDSASATVDHIYSWGGQSQFGAWPGKAITDASVHAVEITNNGILKFEGHEKLIYKIPVVIGYPTTGDDSFQLNNGTDEAKTADLPLVAGAAYWWEGGANSEAGLSLDLLVAAEALRNAVEKEGGHLAYSVCGISKEDATTIVTAYNEDLSDGGRTMVNNSTVYTYDGEYDGEHTPDQTDVSYKDVMEQLAIIAGIPLVGSSRTVSSPVEATTTSSTTLVAVVAVIALLSVSSITVLLVIKKRKHE